MWSAGGWRRTANIAVLVLAALALVHAQDAEPQKGHPTEVAEETGPSSVEGLTPAPAPAGDGQAEASESPTAAPTEDPNETLAKINCEMKVTQIGGELVTAGMKINEAKTELANITMKVAEVKQAWDQKFNEGSSAQQVQFGMDYMNLKHQIKKLQKRDVDDARYKDTYMKLRTQVPDIQKQVATLEAEIKLLKSRMPTLIEDENALHEQIVHSLKSNSALKKQFPLNKQILDNRYAKDIVKANADLARAKRSFQMEDKRDLAAEQELQPLTQGLEKTTSLLVQGRAKLKRFQGDARSQNLKTVKATKDMQESMGLLTLQYMNKFHELNKARSMEIKAKKDGRAEQMEQEHATQEKMDKQAVKLEEKDEQNIEEEEKEEEPSAGISEEEQEQQELIKQKEKVQARVDQRISKAEEKAAREVDIVKEAWHKKLQAEKGEVPATVVRNSVQGKLADEKEAVRKLSDELRNEVKP